MLLGYLGFHTEKYVSDDLLSSLDVLCMLYGNYILKRLIAGRNARTNKIIPKAFSIAASDYLPGTKIQKLLECLHDLVVFNFGLYCTVHENIIIAEYVANNKVCTYLKKHYPWHVVNTFIEDLKKTQNDHWYKLADFPWKIIDFVLYKDKRNPEEFSVQMIPICVDGELVGLWMFVFSENKAHGEKSVDKPPMPPNQIS